MKRRLFTATFAAAAALGFMAAAPAHASGPLYMLPDQPGVSGAAIGGAAGVNEFGNPNISPRAGWVPDPYYRSDPFERANLPRTQEWPPHNSSAKAPPGRSNESAASKRPELPNPFNA